jgi:hypothetical protein
MSEFFEVRLEDALKAAWKTFLKSPEVFITIAFGLLGCSMVLAHLPLVGPLVTVVLWALGPAAFYLAADEASRAGAASFSSLKALPQLFPQLLALFVVKSIVIALGFCLLVLPGVYLAVLLVFAELYVVAEGKGFLDAMVASKNLVHGHWLAVFGLCLVLGLIAFSGALLIGLGLLLTAPYAAITLYHVFRRSHPRVVG